MIANWRRRRYVVTALGISQIVGFGTTYYLPAVLAHPIANDTGWSYTAVVSGLSLAMIVSGMVATRVGRAIETYGGRPVLAASAIVAAAGMALMGLAPRLEVYLFGWFIIGLGMSAGLYDAVFSTLGRLYGVTARSPISWVTLFGGFASTVCWPLSAWLVEAYGWRATCLTYAAVYLMINLPAFLVFVPDTPRRVVVAGGRPPDLDAARRHRVSLTLMVLISTVASMIASTVAVHLLAIIQANGVTLAAAVALGTVLGPAQVAGRMAELVFGSRLHPIWATFAAVTLIALGLIVLATGQVLAAMALILFGAGNGIYTIARGALPLVLFDAREYALIMGRMAMPSLIAQAIAPAIAALVMDRAGAPAVLHVLIALALANLLLVWLLYRRRIAT